MDFPGFLLMSVWSYGFLGALFTRSVWFPVAIFAIFHYIIAWNMGAMVSGEAKFHHIVTVLAMVTIGSIVGIMYAWALRLPQLYPVEVFLPRRTNIRPYVKTAFGNLIFPASLLMATIGIYYIFRITPGILGTPIDSQEFLVLGIILLTFGALILLGIVIDSAFLLSPFPWSKLLYHDSQRYPPYLALFYGLVLAILLTPNAINDFLIETFPIWPIGVVVAINTVLYLLLYSILRVSRPLANIFDKRGNERRFTAFVAVTALVHIVTLLVFWGVSVITESDPQIIFVILSSVSVVWFLAAFPLRGYIVPFIYNRGEY